MAHRKKKNNETAIQPQQLDKMDQLIALVWGLANELKNVKQELNDVKAWNIVPQWPEVVSAEDYAKMNEPQKVVEVVRETPYKVIPIESIIRDEWYLDPARQWIKKIYRWMWRTFKNKLEATNYLEWVKKHNPWTQYDIFPV